MIQTSLIPTPASLRPARPAGPASAVTAPSASDPSKFGHVDEAGRVYLHAPEGEVLVGQWAAGPISEGLAFFGRKYDDLVVEVDLAAARLADGRSSPDQAANVLARVREGLAQRNFVGDVAALEVKCTKLEQQITVATERAAAEREAQKVAASQARQALAQQAEGLADSTAWKATSERYAALIEEWKSLPHTDRAREQELWKRISAARSAFDKRRRQHFAELESQRKEALSAKRDILAQAEALATSTDWAGTGRRFRDLMTLWRQAPRGGKRDEDRLWLRFKAAQDAFQAARIAAESAEQATLEPNAALKEQLLQEAEALLPVTDPRAAKAAMRSILERWEKVGDVPRAQRDRLEGRLKRVEEGLRKAEADTWKRSNPEARARAESTAMAFADGLARMRTKLADAQARGDQQQVIRLQTSIEQTEALLRAAEAAASEFGG